jgi:hypothetical protein
MYADLDVHLSLGLNFQQRISSSSESMIRVFLMPFFYWLEKKRNNVRTIKKAEY